MIFDRLQALTVDDVVRAGACRDGVLDVRDRIAPTATQLPVTHILRVVTNDERSYVLRAAGLDGYGDGYGSGYGYGCGYGYG